MDAGADKNAVVLSQRVAAVMSDSLGALPARCRTMYPHVATGRSNACTAQSRDGEIAHARPGVSAERL